MSSRSANCASGGTRPSAPRFCRAPRARPSPDLVLAAVGAAKSSERSRLATARASSASGARGMAPRLRSRDRDLVVEREFGACEAGGAPRLSRGILPRHAPRPRAMRATPRVARARASAVSSPEPCVASRAPCVGVRSRRRAATRPTHATTRHRARVGPRATPLAVAATIRSQLRAANMWRADCTAHSPRRARAPRAGRPGPRAPSRVRGEKFGAFATPDIGRRSTSRRRSPLRHFAAGAAGRRVARHAFEARRSSSRRRRRAAAPSDPSWIPRALAVRRRLPGARAQRWAARLATTARRRRRRARRNGRSSRRQRRAMGACDRCARPRGRAASVRRWRAAPHAYRDEFYSVQDFAVDGAPSPPTEP